MEPKLQNLSKKILKNLYLSQDMSCLDIANIYNVTKTSIERKLKQFNIKTKNRNVNIINKTFGHLKVIKYLDKIKRGKDIKERYVCLCKCGQTKICFKQRLLDGRNTSCGCMSGGQNDHKNKIHSKEPFVLQIDNYILLNKKQFNNIKYNAKKRNLEFNISYEDLIKLYEKQDKKCALSGLPIHFSKFNQASLDRIDSNKGYIKDNIQWIYIKLNFMKSTLNIIEFLNLCKLVTEWKN